MAEEEAHNQQSESEERASGSSPAAPLGAEGRGSDSVAPNADGGTDDAGGGARTATGPNVELPSFQQVLADVEAGGIDLLHDVELDVKIELGRTHMLVEDVLRLAEGSVVELDKLAGDPVDVYVNDRLVARGEVLVLNDNFCVRINEIITDAGDAGGAEGEAGDSAARTTDQAGVETAGSHTG